MDKKYRMNGQVAELSAEHEAKIKKFNTWSGIEPERHGTLGSRKWKYNLRDFLNARSVQPVSGTVLEDWIHRYAWISLPEPQPKPDVLDLGYCTPVVEINCTTGKTSAIKYVIETVLELDCGHDVIYTDESGRPDKEIFCPAPCNDVYFCGHDCPKLCYEDCGRCHRVTVRTYPCGHQQVFPCKDLYGPLDICKVLVAQRWSACGHVVMVPCHLQNTLDRNALTEYCTAPCGEVHEEPGCGHLCKGSCQECYQRAFHVRCRVSCGKSLICGHICTESCTQACPPCLADCEMRCEHGQCPETCGYPCGECEKPCLWQCPHHTCKKTCGEVCDRPPCEHPCPKVLPCGHPCVSFCGEPCPPLCRTCNKLELELGLIGIKDEVEEADRFILLQDCGHVIERSLLDTWMKASGGQVYQKTCPLCEQVITRCRRYAESQRNIRRDVRTVKYKIFGNPEKIVKVQEEALALLGSENQRFTRIKTYLTRLLLATEKEFGDCVKLSLVELESILFMSIAWSQAEERMLYFAEHVPDYAMEELEAAWKWLFEEIMARDLPLRPLEVRDVRRQLDRLHDFGQLYQRASTKMSRVERRLFNTEAASEAFRLAENRLWSWGPYDEQGKGRFRAALKKLDEALHCTLGITDEEQDDILNAVGLSAGRWFKCGNGHVYLITECGGATEVGLCTECGVQIGGENHQLLSGNNLATEMDGALVPIYQGPLIVEEDHF